MDSLILQLRQILGSPTFESQSIQDYFYLFEWLIGALLLLIVVSFVFKILLKLLTK